MEETNTRSGGSLASKIGIIGAIAVIIGFFLPWIGGVFKFSGYDLLTMPSPRRGGDAEKYLLIVPPLAAAVFLIHILLKRLAGKGLTTLLKILPILAFLIYSVLIFIKITDNRPVEIGAVFEIFTFGYWITLAGAFLMSFHRDS